MVQEMVAVVTEDHLFQCNVSRIGLLSSFFACWIQGLFCWVMVDHNANFVTGTLMQRSIRSGVKFLLFRKAKIQSIDRLWIESRPKLNKLRLASQQQQQHAKLKGISSVLSIITTITSSFIAVSQLYLFSLSHLLPLSFFFQRRLTTKQKNLFPRS